MSIISTHMKYMNTLNFQIFLHYWTYMNFVKCEIVSVHNGKLFFNTTEIENPCSVNGDDYSHNE